MKLTINDCSDLRDIFLILKKKASRSDGILSYVLLEGHDDETITLTVTDFTTTKTIAVEGSVEEPGAVAIDLYDFDKIAKPLKKQGGPLTFELEDANWVSVSHKKLDFRLNGEHVDDFPSVPDFTSPQYTSLDVDRITEVLESTRKAISSDDARANLTGLYFDGEIAVSTDGHRLRKMKVGADKIDEMIIPGDAIEIVRYAIKKIKSDEILYAVHDGHAFFAVGDLVVSSREIEGSFPDYTQVLPKASKERARVDVADLIEGLKLIEPFVLSKTKNVRFSLSDDGLEVYASDPGTGEGKSLVPCDYAGAPVKAGFNVDYLFDAFKDFDGEILIDLTGTLSPCSIVDAEKADKGDEEDVWIVMPMRL